MFGGTQNRHVERQAAQFEANAKRLLQRHPRDNTDRVSRVPARTHSGRAGVTKGALYYHFEARSLGYASSTRSSPPTSRANVVAALYRTARDPTTLIGAVQRIHVRPAVWRGGGQRTTWRRKCSSRRGIPEPDSRHLRCLARAVASVVQRGPDTEAFAATWNR